MSQTVLAFACLDCESMGQTGAGLEEHRLQLLMEDQDILVYGSASTLHELGL